MSTEYEEQQGVLNYNHKLFENMAFTSNTVWDMNFEEQKVHVLYDDTDFELNGKTLTFDEIMGKMKEAEHPDDLDNLLQIFNTSFLKCLGKTLVIETRTLTYGKYETVKKIITPCLDEEGEVSHVYVTFQNIQRIIDEKQRHKDEITALKIKRAAALAKRSDEVLDMVNEILGSGLWNMTFDTNGNLEHVFWSTRFRKLLGFENPQDLPNNMEAFEALLHPDDKDRLYDAIADTVYAKADFDVKLRIRMSEGRYDWFRSRAKAERHASGIASYIVGTIININAEEVKAADMSMRLEAERLMFRGAILKSSSYAFVVDVTEGIIVDEMDYGHDKYMLRSMGFEIPADYDLVNKKFIEQNSVAIEIVRSANPFTAKGLMELYEEGSLYSDVVYYMPRDDRYIRVTPLLYKDPLNEHVMATVIGYDVTDFKRSEHEKEQALRNAITRAEEASRAKTNFLSNMSHDIRTPLNAIIGYTDLSLDEFEEKENVREYIGKIKESGLHLRNLINDVLDMSRIESGKTSVDESKMSISEIMEDIRNMIAADVSVKKQTLEFGIMDVRNDCVWGDKLRLKQVLINCISNSIKYTEDGGALKFKVYEKASADSEKANFEFVIQDNGIGMSQEFVERIFEPFERAHNSTVSGIQGTGLGMAISKSLVEIMGGTIDVQSTLGSGTKFTIRIGFKIAEPDDRQSAAEEEASVEGVKILLVEDNEMNRDIASLLLQKNGAVVDVAVNGYEAFNKVNEYPAGTYDVVLMDIQMPVMDGYTASKKIRDIKDTEKATVPIIALTANAFEEDRQISEQAGMDAHVAKPINIKTIISVVDKCVKNKNRIVVK